jgi:uncharacterized protein YdhG (YjbR/CyaY superfamily)
MNGNIRKFVEAGSAEQQAYLNKLGELILRLYPAAELQFWYGMPTYRLSKHGWVCLSYWKDGVTLLTKEPDAIAAFKAANPKFKTNKASINFRLTDEIPEQDLARVITAAMTAN